MAKKKRGDIQGTIHELDVRLAETVQDEEAKPHTDTQIKFYKKVFDKLKLFPAKATAKKKTEIIKNLKIDNIDADEVFRQQEILKSTINFNAAINRARKKIEDEIRAGKNVKKNDKILKGFEEFEIPISREIRENLNIHKKRIRLVPKSLDEVKNRIKYYSGQDYSYLVKDGFSRPQLIPQKELNKINEEGNVVAFMLDKFRKDLDNTYEMEKRKFAIKDPKKWKLKQKAFKKLYTVIDHNINIATNKRYNKKLVQRDAKGNIVKDQSEYPVRLDILGEMIVLFI